MKNLKILTAFNIMLSTLLLLAGCSKSEPAETEPQQSEEVEQGSPTAEPGRSVKAPAITSSIRWRLTINGSIASAPIR